MTINKFKRLGQRLLSPANIILLTLVFIVLAQGSAAWFLTNQPWTGLRLQADKSSGFLRITSVDKGSPASFAHIPADTILTTIKSETKSITLNGKTYTHAHMSRTHKDYQDYLKLQSDLYQLLESTKPFEVISNNKKTFIFSAEPETPISAIPIDFWIVTTVLAVVPLIGILVWSYKPYTQESAILLIYSFAHYGYYLLSTIRINTDLAISPEKANFIIIGHILLLNIFVFCLVTLFCNYPKKILNKYFSYFYAPCIIFFPLNMIYSWIDFPFGNYTIQSVPPFIFGLWSSHQQVMYSKGNPSLQITAKIIQASLLLPHIPIFLLFIIPVSLGSESLVNYKYVQLAAIVMFAGIAAGIARYRLFEIEYWWFKSWLWLLGGIIVILLDIALVTLFYTPQIYALGLSVILAGFIYFPIRQWLLGKIMPLDNQAIQDFLPTLSKLMSGAVSGSEFEQRWQTVLQQRFRPLHLDKQPTTLPQPVLSDNGLHLSIPSLDGKSSYRLTGKQLAARLFGQNDRKTVIALLDIARIASNASASRKQAVLNERRRIMHDLHDTVGARLLTLSHSIPDVRQRKTAQDTLQILRDMIHLNLQKTPDRLEEHLADWRAEIIDLTESAGVRLDWHSDERIHGTRLPPVAVVDLATFLRETVAGFLQQPGLENITIKFRASEKNRQHGKETKIAVEIYPNDDANEKRCSYV